MTGTVRGPSRGRRALVTVALLAAALGFLFPDSAPAQETQTDRVLAGLTACDLGDRTSDLSILFLLDESGSLKTHDENGERVTGTVSALAALDDLARMHRAQGITIRVALHGFAQDYRANEEAWTVLDSPERLADLQRRAEQYRTRNSGSLTDYTKALEGAVAELEGNGTGCRALVWFTDGEFDSERGTDGYLSDDELAQIRDSLCAVDGPVDRLRSAEITLIAIGLSNKDLAEAKGVEPPDLSLVEAIASGTAVASADLGLPDNRCGTLRGTGDLYEADRPADLIGNFARILGDIVFESLEELPPPRPCEQGANTCTVAFRLGPWVDRFDLFFKLPPPQDGKQVTTHLTAPGHPALEIGRPDGPLAELSGISGRTPSVSWRKIEGIRSPGGPWDGPWHLTFTGPDAREARANLALFEGSLTVELTDRSNIDTEEPRTFDGLELLLRSDSRTVDCSNRQPPVSLAFSTTFRGKTVSTDPIEAEAGEPCLVPATLLAEALESGPGDEFVLAIEVTPSIRFTEDDEVPPLQYPPSTITVWLQETVTVELSGPSDPLLRRSDPTSTEGIGVRLLKGGRPLDTNDLTVTLRTSTAELSLAASSSHRFEPGEALVLPSDLLQSALAAEASRSLLHLDLLVDPDLRTDDGTPPTAGPASPLRLWIIEPLRFTRLDPDRVLDRQDPDTYLDHQVGTSIGGGPLDAEGLEVELRLAADVADGPASIVSLDPSRGFTVPPELLVDALKAADEDLSLLTIHVHPVIRVDGDLHPGLAPQSIQFGVRSGPGFPTILEARASDLHDDDPGLLTVRVLGPDQGSGVVTIRSATPTSEDLEGTVSVAEATCEIPGGRVESCEAELSADFTANRTVVLDVTVERSGTDTQPPGQVQTETISVAFEMTRPLDKTSFISTLLLYLLLFVLVQLLLRAAYTTWLARWDGVPVGSRFSTLDVVAHADGRMTGPNGVLTVNLASTMFASELEGRNSSAELDGVRFEIRWLRTFLGERDPDGFGRTQRALIRATTSTGHCLAPEGFEASDDGRATGLVGSTLTGCWVLQLPDDAPSRLRDGESVDARLLVVFQPDGVKSADEQLRDVANRAEDVTTRDMPRILDLAPTATDASTEQDSVTAGEGSDRPAAASAPPGGPDPFDAPPPDPNDPFGGRPDSPPSDMGRTGSDEGDDWSPRARDPDDPFA